MKISDIKHNHSLTDLLKVLLFAILMLAPVGMVATKCLYAIVNKNAYQSYTSASVEMKSETNSLLVGVNYYYGYTGNTTGQTNNTTAIIPLNTISIELNSQTEFIRFTNSGTLMQYDENQQNLNLPISVDYCTFSVSENTTLQTQPWYKTYTIVYTEQKLDNIFEYSVTQLEQSSLFNWTQNTAIYSGIAAMNSQLGINAPAISILLAYWFLLSVIYIIIDIIIKSFTILTHMIGSKKA